MALFKELAASGDEDFIELMKELELRGKLQEMQMAGTQFVTKEHLESNLSGYHQEYLEGLCQFNSKPYPRFWPRIETRHIANPSTFKMKHIFDTIQY